MLLRQAVPITAASTAAELHDMLAELGARLILRALVEQPVPVAQPGEGVTYAPKLTREAGRIDWARDAAAIERQVHAFDPWPGTSTTLHGAVLKVLAVQPASGSGRPGAVLDERLTIACGAEALRLTRVQLSGRPVMTADAFLRGHEVAPGTVLGG
jgi:methionyl-tRNA formyltransferase